MKAQSSAEYLIIFVVVMVALATMIYIIAFSSSDTLQGGVVQLPVPGKVSAWNYQVDPIGVTFQLSNGRSQMITVHDISINSEQITFTQLPLMLLPGEDIRLRSYSLASSSANSYIHTVVLNITDNSGTNVLESYMFSGDSVTLSPEYLNLQLHEPLAKDLVLLLSEGKDVSGYRHVVSNGAAGDGVFGTGTTIPSGNISISDASSLRASDAFTIAGWFKVDAHGGEVYFFNKGTSFSFLWGGGRIFYMMHNGAGWTNPQYAYGLNNDWHHYAFTVFNGEAMKLYVDGVHVASHTIAVLNPTNNETALEIGTGFTGYADQVAMWQRALSDHEIASLYDRGMLAMG